MYSFANLSPNREERGGGDCVIYFFFLLIFLSHSRTPHTHTTILLLSFSLILARAPTQTAPCIIHRVSR